MRRKNEFSTGRNDADGIAGQAKAGQREPEIHGGGFIDYILQDITMAIGGEKDDFRASCLNVRHG